MRYIVLLVIMIGCGSQATNQFLPSPAVPDSSCLMKDECTNADVAGYECRALRYEPDVGDGTKVPSQDFEGHSCMITQTDYQSSPSCDPQNPDQMCHSGWGANATSYPCCQTIQGPGPEVQF